MIPDDEETNQNEQFDPTMKPSPIWREYRSVTDFRRAFPEFRYRPEVPESIQKQLNVVHHPIFSDKFDIVFKFEPITDPVNHNKFDLFIQEYRSHL